MDDIMNIPEYLLRRKELRNHSTSAESVLWRILKSRNVCGLKFRRQHSVGPYILDFYCPQIKLAIELDGEVHKGKEAYDEQRSCYLSQIARITVVRFENRVVFETPEVIINFIEEIYNRFK